ncbi:lipopolysaccharide-binding protein-like [Antedon mediterranea]|uniref:lipopolysaccharide-binding protein-like n=1 Tax=Antedon mediterranea TaxID=105859 RepID=UPI003AF43E1E
MVVFSIFYLFSVVFNIDEYAYADLSLVSAPKFSEQAFQSLHKGEILSRKDQQNVSVPNPEIPAHTETSRMIYLWLTEYRVASAANVYFKAGVMEYLITNDMVPSKFSLNTSKYPFNKTIPQIEKEYPNLDMVANFEVTSPPVLNMTTEGLKCSLVGLLNFYVTQENKEAAFVFSLSVSMSLSASVSVNTKKNAITGSFTLDSSSFKFAESAEKLGEISANVKKLDKVMDTLFGTIIPKVNEKAAEGLPIPIFPGIELVKPEISFGKGYILIATDINHTISLEYSNVMKMYKDIKNYNRKDEL